MSCEKRACAVLLLFSWCAPAANRRGLGLSVFVNSMDFISVGSSVCGVGVALRSVGVNEGRCENAATAEQKMHANNPRSSPVRARMLCTGRGRGS